MEKYNNVCYTWQPKYVTGYKNEVCFVPAVRQQQGVNFNYIVVCCSPAYNGIWRWKAEDKDQVKVWKNKRLDCYYVRQGLCEPYKKLEDIVNFEVRKMIATQQEKWLHTGVRKEVPAWFLINKDEDLQKEFPEYARKIYKDNH